MNSLFNKDYYETSSSDIDLSEIISISLSCDRMLVSVEEYFRNEYQYQTNFREYKDSLIQVAWGVCDYSMACIQLIVYYIYNFFYHHILLIFVILIY